ncbi:DUF551 domain-containing protein [Klebsiella quasipneumoniae]
MTSKLTRERLQEIINLACKTCSDGSVIYPKTYTTVDSKEIVELARMALAAIDGEQVVQCPYPCGWDTLNKLAIQDAAFVALALVAGEPATESIRSAVISNNDRLLKVISFCRDAMPNPKSVVTQKECQKCKGTGIADSGGVQPWGEPISIECDCATSQSIAVMDIDELRLAFEAKERESDEGFNLHKYGIGYADDATQARWEQWLACRAAMLQTQSDDDGEPTDDERIMAIEGIHNCERCGDEGWVVGEMGITRCACGQADNSPVIGIDQASGPDCSVEVRYVAPPGYVMVPKDLISELRDWAHPEIEKYCEMWEGRRDSEFPALRKVIADADALLAAATQSPGSEPATVPGKWIPVSERMPPRRYEVLVGCWWGEKPRWCCKWATYIPGHPDAQSSGWLIAGASWTPTHWMPLPAAPQEVKSES